MSNAPHSQRLEATVFVVEDDDSVRNGLEFLFSSARLTVRAFASAEDFLDAQPVADTGCVLLDVHLPGMSGLDLLDQMPDGVAALPVICVTGGPGKRLSARAYEVGAFAFVHKPLAQDQLLRLVCEAIDQGSNGNCVQLRSA